MWRDSRCSAELWKFIRATQNVGELWKFNRCSAQSVCAVCFMGTPHIYTKIVCQRNGQAIAGSLVLLSDNRLPCHEIVDIRHVLVIFLGLVIG